MQSRLRILPLVTTIDIRTTFTIDDPACDVLDFEHNASLTVVAVRDCRERYAMDMSDVALTDRLVFDLSLAMGGEYKVVIHRRGSSWQDEPIWTGQIFAVPVELCGLIPWKGDLHMHSTYSDGTDAPAVMAAASKANGLDFACVTDHRNYDGSLSAIAEAEKWQIDTLLIPGEEVNYCLGLGHVVALNTTKSISDSFPLQQDRKVLENFDNFSMLIDHVIGDVEDRISEIDLPAQVDRRLFGFLLWVVDKIHQAGGIAVAAHPFWSSHGVMDLIRSTLDGVVSSKLVEAVEVFGGMSDEHNLQSFAHFQSMPSREFSLLGSSDAHGALTGQLGRIWTVVFARHLDIDEVMGAIVAGRTAPCLRLSGGQVVVAGDASYVEYTHYLNRTFFPMHDRVSGEIGNLYLQSLKTGRRETKKIDTLKSELAQLYIDSFHFPDCGT